MNTDPARQMMTYKVIKSISQYNLYCKRLAELLDAKPKSAGIRDEIELLTLLIDTWDEKHHSTVELDPVELLKSFMKDHELKACDLAEALRVSKSYMSEILNYKKTMSKEMIRALSARFKVKQEAFNRPYPLIGKSNAGASVTTS